MTLERPVGSIYLLYLEFWNVLLAAYQPSRISKIRCKRSGWWDHKIRGVGYIPGGAYTRWVNGEPWIIQWQRRRRRQRRFDESSATIPNKLVQCVRSQRTKIAPPRRNSHRIARLAISPGDGRTVRANEPASLLCCFYSLTSSNPSVVTATARPGRILGTRRVLGRPGRSVRVRPLAACSGNARVNVFFLWCQAFCRRFWLMRVAWTCAERNTNFDARNKSRLHRRTKFFLRRFGVFEPFFEALKIEIQRCRHSRSRRIKKIP